MKALRKILSLVLCLTQIITPELVRATAIVDDTNFVHSRHFNTGILKESKRGRADVLHPLTSHPVRPDKDGAFRLTFDPQLFKKNKNVFLTYKNDLVGMVSYENDILQLIGANKYNFILEGSRDPSLPFDLGLPSTITQFYAQVGGSLTINDAKFGGAAHLHAKKLFLNGQLEVTEELIAHGAEECTINGNIIAGAAGVKTKNFSHQGMMTAADIFLEIERGNDTANSLIQSVQNIEIQGFKEYNHAGTFAANRSVITEGDSYSSLPGSKTFAGLVQSFKGKQYRDAGRTVAWQRLLETPNAVLEAGSEFNGHYFVSACDDPASVIEVKERAQINVAKGLEAYSTQKLIHHGSIKLRPDLELLPLWKSSSMPLHTTAFVKDYQQLQDRMMRYQQEYESQFNSFMGIHMESDGLLDFGKTGVVDAIDTSVRYKANDFLFSGYSRSGTAKGNQTLIDAQTATCDGRIVAPNLLEYHMKDWLNLNGEVQSDITAIVGGKSNVYGHVQGSLDFIKADEVNINSANEGDWLNVQAKRYKLGDKGNLNYRQIVLDVKKGRDSAKSQTKSEQDIVIKGFEEYEHEGTFAAQRSVVKEGDSYKSLAGSQNFAGLVDHFKGKHYTEAGRTVAWLRHLETPTALLDAGSEFNGQYFISTSNDPASVIDIREGAQINVGKGLQAYSAQGLIHHGSIKLRPELELLPLWKASFEKDYQQLQHRITGYQQQYTSEFDPFTGIQMETDGLFDFGKTGVVDARDTNVRYKANNLLFSGYSHSGSSKGNHTFIDAHTATCDGRLIAPNLLQFSMQELLTLNGDVQSDVTAIFGGKSKIHGHVKGALSISKADEVEIDSSNEGDWLNIQAKKYQLGDKGNLNYRQIVLDVKKGRDSAKSQTKSEQDIIIKGFEEYEHEGTFAAQRSVVAEGDSYNSLAGSQTFAGLLQHFKGKHYTDAGRTVAWLRHLETPHAVFEPGSEFNGYYFTSATDNPASVIDVRDGAQINVAKGLQAYSAQTLSHHGSIKLRPDLELLPLWKASFEKDYQKLQARIKGYQQEYASEFNPFTGIHMETDGVFDFGKTGIVDAIDTNVRYKANNLLFSGYSRSGSSKGNQTFIDALTATCDGRIIAPNLLQFNMRDLLTLKGDVQSDVTAIVGGKSKIHGHVKGALSISKTDEVNIDSFTEGDWLNIQAKKYQLGDKGNLNYRQIVLDVKKGRDSAKSQTKSEQDIVIKGFEDYEHEGTFAAHRSVVAEGDSYNSLAGSQTFAGLLQHFKGKHYTDAGRTVAWLRHLETTDAVFELGSEFNGHYFMSTSDDPASVIEVKEGAQINVAKGLQAYSAQKLIHHGSIRLRSDLELLPLWKASFEKDYQKLQARIKGYQQEYASEFNPFTGITIGTAGKFDFGRMGQVDVDKGSIRYKTDDFGFEGFSRSGDSKHDHTLIEADRANCRGKFVVPNVLQFNIHDKLALDGHVQSSLISILGGKSEISGLVQSSLTVAKAESVTISGHTEGQFLRAQTKIFDLKPEGELKLADEMAVSSNQATLHGTADAGQVVIDAADKAIEGILTVRGLTLLTGDRTRFNALFSTTNLYADGKTFDWRGNNTVSKQAHLEMTDRVSLTGDNNIQTLSITSGNSINHTGHSDVTNLTCDAPQKTLCGKITMSELTTLWGGSTRTNGDFTTKNLLADEINLTLGNKTKIEKAHVTLTEDLILEDLASIDSLLATAGTFTQRAQYTGGQAHVTAKRGIFAGPTTLSGDLECEIQALNVSKPLRAKNAKFNTQTTGITDLVELTGKGVFVAPQAFDNKGKILSVEEDLLFTLGSNYQLGDFKAKGWSVIEPDIFPADISSILAGKYPQYTKSGGLHFVSKKPYTFYQSINVPWSIGLTAPSITSAVPITSKKDVLLHATKGPMKLFDVTSQIMQLSTPDTLTLTGVLCPQTYGDLKASTINVIGRVADMDPAQYEALVWKHLTFLRVNYPEWWHYGDWSIPPAGLDTTEISPFVLLGGGIVTKTGHVALHYTNYKGTHDLIDVNHLWLDGKNRHDSNGVIKVKGVLVKDTPSVEITRSQYNVDGNGTIKSYPVENSGLLSARCLVEHFGKDVSKFFPDRPEAGNRKGRSFIFKGGEINIGDGGMDMQTSQQIVMTPNTDVTAEQYKHRINRKKHEYRLLINQIPVPPVLKNTGPVNLRSPYILLQGLQVHAMGPNAHVRIFADKQLDLQGLIARVHHKPFEIKRKGNRYQVEGFHDELLNNAFFAPEATVSLGAGVRVTGFEPLYVGNKPQISAPSVVLEKPELESGQTVTLISQKKTNKRLGSFVSLAVGMALNFFLPGAGTAIGAMVQATGTAAASQFAGSVVAHNGNFGHALKDMRSTQGMRSLIAAAATANFGGQAAPISSLDQFVEQLPAYLAKGMGTGAISAAIQKQNILRGIADGARFGAASAVGNFGATNLGQAYNYGEGQMSYAQHKLGHLALGGALGAIISKDRLKGALIGGLSAGGAEIVAEALMGDVKAQVMSLKEAGITDEQVTRKMMNQARFNSEFSKFASATIAAASNQNVTTALFTASNAVENNFCPSISEEVAQAFRDNVAKMGEFATTDVEDVLKAKDVAERAIDTQLADIDETLKSKKHKLSYFQRSALLHDKIRLQEARGNLQRLPTTRIEIAVTGVGGAGNIGVVAKEVKHAYTVLRGLQKGAEVGQTANNATKMASKGAKFLTNNKAGDLAESSHQAHFLRNNLTAREIGGGHALEKHVISQGEFPGWIRTRQQLTTHIEQVLNDPTTLVKNLSNNRTAFWHPSTSTVVIRNPKAMDGGTVFQPFRGVKYFEDL